MNLVRKERCDISVSRPLPGSRDLEPHIPILILHVTNSTNYDVQLVRCSCGQRTQWPYAVRTQTIKSHCLTNVAQSQLLCVFKREILSSMRQSQAENTVSPGLCSIPIAICGTQYQVTPIVYEFIFLHIRHQNTYTPCVNFASSCDRMAINCYIFACYV